MINYLTNTEAVKFGKAVVNTLAGSASNNELTRVTAHLMNAVPGVDVHADHIGWANTMPKMNGRYGDLLVTLPDGGSFLYEAEPQNAFNSAALNQVRDLNEVQSTTVITNPSGVKQGTEYFAARGHAIPVTDPFSAAAGVASGVVGFGFEWAGRGILLRAAGKGAALAGVGPIGSFVISVVATIVGTRVARTIYNRFLKTHVESAVEYAVPKAKGLWGRLKQTVKKVVTKTKVVLSGFGKRASKGLQQVAESLGELFGPSGDFGVSGTATGV